MPKPKNKFTHSEPAQATVESEVIGRCDKCGEVCRECERRREAEQYAARKAK